MRPETSVNIFVFHGQGPSSHAGRDKHEPATRSGQRKAKCNANAAPIEMPPTMALSIPRCFVSANRSFPNASES